MTTSHTHQPNHWEVCQWQADPAYPTWAGIGTVVIVGVVTGANVTEALTAARAQFGHAANVKPLHITSPKTQTANPHPCPQSYLNSKLYFAGGDN